MLFKLIILLSPLALFAGEGGTDIIPRTINFLIFAAILYRFVAAPLKNFFKGRRDEIVTTLKSIQEKVEESKKAKAEAQKKLEDSKHYWTDASKKYASSRLKTQCNKICLTQTEAKYKTVSKQVLVSPASSKKVKTPEKYTIVKVKKIEQKAKYKKVVIPEEYITVITERERTKGYSKWMPMICEEMLTPKIIKKVQRALQFQGFYKGSINGIWNIESKLSARAYQKAKGLAVTSKLSIETMNALGIF